jgi:hypothetical protein
VPGARIATVVYSPSVYPWLYEVCRSRSIVPGRWATITERAVMPLKAHDRWALVQVKIERAKKHLLELESEVGTYKHKKLTVVIAEPNPYTGERFNMVGLPELPFNVLPTAGDVVHNLRSALDYLAYQLVRFGSGKEPSRRVEFPIAKDKAAYESDSPRKVEGMRPEAIEAIDRLKPYKGGNETLWRIHELDNIDKHRSLFTVAHDYLFSADWLPPVAPDRTFLMRASEPHFSGVFDTEVEKEIQLELDKAITNPEVAKSNALLPTLRQLVYSVEDLVAKFVPFLE